MGRHHSDSDDSYSRSSKKKKRRSRSRSSSRSSGDSRSYKSKKSKKSSHRRRSRSRSRSAGSMRRRRRRDSRSRSRDRRRSRSRSRGYSPPRRRRGHSRSSSRRRSRSPARRRSKSPRRRSRSRSVSSTKSSRREKGDSRGSSQLKIDTTLPHAKQSELQLQLALKAAAAADEKLKEAGLLPVGVGRSFDEIELTFKEQQDRINAFEAIEDDHFEAARFTSNRQQKAASSQDDKLAEATHDNAIFGVKPLEIKQDAVVKTKLIGSIMHPCFYVPMEAKMERWRNKLVEMRSRKLEGEAM